MLRGFDGDPRSLSHITHLRSNVLCENPRSIEKTLCHETNIRTSDTVRSFTKQSISDFCSSGNSGLASHCDGFECVRDPQQYKGRDDNHEPGFAASRTDNWPLPRRGRRFSPTRQISPSRSFRIHCCPYLVRSTNRWQLWGLPVSISKHCRPGKECHFQPPRLREVAGCKEAASMAKPSVSTQNLLGPRSGTVLPP